MAGTRTNNFSADSSASAGVYGCIGSTTPAPRQADDRTHRRTPVSFFPYQANSVRLAMTDHVRRSRAPFSRLAAGLLLAVGLFAGHASAQVITHDPMTLESIIAEYGKEFERWKETLSQYQKEYAHYQQQLIKLQSLNLGTTNLEDNFNERDPNYGVAEACPGSGGGLGSIMTSIKSILPNMDGNLVTEQTKICQLMVMTENARYNESVRMLKRLIQRNKDFEQKIQSQRNSVGTSQGALAANDNEVSRFMAQNSMDLDYWQAKLKAYDYYEASLKSDQRKLTKRALDGNKGGGIPLVTQLVQAAALKAALSVD
ncbi:hypothetical protein [Xanthomonas euvesicatoria]|uniref:hypothetical protein n=1 Tax=Xanthomonas euvesicatoria TaxID=456327 RepID=UPI0031BB7BCE